MQLKSGVWLAAIAVGGCTATADVVGRIGNGEEVFRGQAVGYASGDGVIDLANGAGVRCTGNFRYVSAHAGVGRLSCSDGRWASIQFTALGMASGYGYGTVSDGSAVNFTYGLTEEESRRYIALPAKPGATKKKASGGTGFFVSSDGHVLTNQHVVDGCSKLSARFADGTRQPAEVVAADASNDLAIAKIATGPAAPAVFGEGPAYRAGDAIVVYGFPLATALASTGNLTTGTISALSGIKNDTRHLQISAPVQPGNSGGPVTDQSGAVIGVVVAKLDPLRMVKATGDIPQNVNFAIKDVVAKDFLRSQGIPFTERKAGPPASSTEIGERMQRYTVALLCEAG